MNAKLTEERQARVRFILAVAALLTLNSLSAFAQAGAALASTPPT